jgi:hypothetical protein
MNETTGGLMTRKTIGIAVLILIAAAAVFFGLFFFPKTAPPTTTSPKETLLLAYTTGYSYWDNTPPGSSTIAYARSDKYQTLHTVAGGTGTYADPITVAVGWAKIGEAEVPDYPPGTRIYIPNVRRYFIVEDLCGDYNDDGVLPQNKPCHTPEQWARNLGAKVQIDLWIDGESGTADSTVDCMSAITGEGPHLAIFNPAPDYVVVPGSLFSNGKCTELFGDTLEKLSSS